MLLTFDCYGTLIDWEAGILGALRSAYPASASMRDRDLLDGFHAAQNRLKTSAYRPYRELLTGVALELATEHGWGGSEDAAARVPESVPAWTPFEDTNRALGRLARAGARLGILSNIDDDLLAGTLEHLAIEFDHIGTAERLRSYKPAVPHFELGLEWAESQGGSASWLHVAQSLYHDIEPATRLGVRTVWVNRRSEELTEAAAPEHIVPDLDAAVDRILAHG